MFYYYGQIKVIDVAVKLLLSSYQYRCMPSFVSGKQESKNVFGCSEHFFFLEMINTLWLLYIFFIRKNHMQQPLESYSTNSLIIIILVSPDLYNSQKAKKT